jgi:hypothetical protein
MRRTPEGTAILHSQDMVNGRDCEFETYLEPGQYVILPRTNGIMLKRPADAECDNITYLNS